MTSFRPLLLPLIFLVTSSCGRSGQGTVTATVYGGPFVEEGIPAAEVDDGWAIDFSRFDVSISQVFVGNPIGGPSTIDVSRPSSGEGHALGSVYVRDGDYTASAFTIARVEVDGSASRGDVVKEFRWVFDAPTQYTECEALTRVDDCGSATFQITLRAEHLFYDSLVADEPRILFQALADADQDGDGTITQAELEGTDIGAYDSGSAEGVDNLWAFLTAQVRTLGHVDGEGYCLATAVDS